jgi:hypothetical protein
LAVFKAKVKPGPRDVHKEGVAATCHYKAVASHRVSTCAYNTTRLLLDT